jgi:hypothetical protein
VTRNRAIAAILTGALIAGTLDLSYAIIFSSFHGVSATRVLQSVASGALGMAAYDGGLPTAVLGTSLHYLIAIAAAAIFFAAGRRWPLLRQRPVLAGAVFGIGVYVVMSFVVLPLSAYPHPLRFTPSRVAANLLAHMILFGQPIAWSASRVQPAR